MGLLLLVLLCILRRKLLRVCWHGSCDKKPPDDLETGLRWVVKKGLGSSRGHAVHVWWFRGSTRHVASHSLGSLLFMNACAKPLLAVLCVGRESTLRHCC
jgi:hypothetical protein